MWHTFYEGGDQVTQRLSIKLLKGYAKKYLAQPIDVNECVRIPTVDWFQLK